MVSHFRASTPRQLDVEAQSRRDRRRNRAYRATSRAKKAHAPAPAQDPDAFADLRALDQWREANLAALTGGVSPESLALAATDWALHLAGAPGKRLELALRLLPGASRRPAGGAAGPGSDDPADHRFASPAWKQWPYRQWAQAFLDCESWWRHATVGVPGIQPHHEQVVSFAARQWLDMWSPSNLPWTNPEVVQRTLEQGGANLWRGGMALLRDLQRAMLQQPPAGSEAFAVGRDLAVTPGQVVMRNRLVELIQYAPTTATVHAEPILIVPAWIMKYYILDLSPHNSLIRWLVSKGHTVFCLSWRNVAAEDRDLSLDDYRRLGIMAALDAISAIVPKRRVHAVGYCLGGTLLAIAAAAMAQSGDERLATTTLLAAQTDFSEPGGMQIFIDPSQVHMIDSMMARRGHLTAEQMSGAFQILRSNDLIWSRGVRDYLMDEPAPMNDLMAWNADSTRMPFRMHSEYLHQLFLDNDLARGRFVVDARPVALQNIRVPIFVVGTEGDRVAPWQSVYKIHYLADADVTFALTNGGHNVGIVNEPGHPHRHYRLREQAATDECLGAQEWFETTEPVEGSWWVPWQHWLARHSRTGRVAAPAIGGPGYSPLAAAPGSYVLER